MTRRTRAEWRELCAGSYESGMTVRAYAERMGVNPRTLSWWRYRLRRELVEPAFVEVAPAPVAAPEPSRVRVAVGRVELALDELPPAAWVADLASSC